MERLNQVIEDAIIKNYWKPIRASRNGPKLPNLCFTDDIILVGEETIEQSNVIQECLGKFCAALGSKVSNAKSRVCFSPNMDDSAKAVICEALNMAMTDDLGSYLGMPTLSS